MKEIFMSVAFLVLIMAVLWGWDHTQRVVSENKDTRPSITTLGQQMPADSVATHVALEQPSVVTETAPTETTQPALTAKNFLEIQAMNGGGAKGSAGKMQALLKQLGYTKALATNASGDYVGVTVYYRAANQADAEAVRTALIATYPSIKLQQAASETSEEGKSPVTVIVGK